MTLRNRSDTLPGNFFHWKPKKQERNLCRIGRFRVPDYWSYFTKGKTKGQETEAACLRSLAGYEIGLIYCLL